ncbi:MAG: hypothetical protein HYS52_00705 [Candidatus Wildermuthbacteria bacterium]|nr:hypothetical protein [Candidatus Wildermuthbacteria bacterium]MBI4135740.1 hypothetical protein [Candidatus Uhrbacteria bacterium]
MGSDNDVPKEVQDFVDGVAAILTGSSRTSLTEIYRELVARVVEHTLDGLGDVLQCLAKEVPYLSHQQASALKEDLRKALKFFGESCPTTVEELEERLATLSGRLGRSDYAFAKTELPRDVIDYALVRRVAEEVVRECFGDFVKALPLVASVSIEREVEKSITAQLKAEDVSVAAS